MLRFIIWFTFWTLTLFFIDIDVKYKDGLHIEFHGWGSKLFKS